MESHKNNSNPGITVILEREDEGNECSSYILGILLLLIVTIPTAILSINDIITLSKYGLPDEDSFYVKIFNEFIEDNKQYNNTYSKDNNIINSIDYNSTKTESVLFQRSYKESLSSICTLKDNNHFFKKREEISTIDYNQYDDDDEEEEDDIDNDDWDEIEEEEFDSIMFFNSFIKMTFKNILITTFLSYLYLILMRFIPFTVTIVSLGVSVTFTGIFIYDAIPALLKYITTNTDIWLWPILIYCIIVVLCIFFYLKRKIIFSVLLLKKTLKFICLWNNFPIYVISFVLTVAGIFVNSIISLAVYGIIVKYDNSEEKSKTITTLYILFYLISYNYYNQLIKKFVNVNLSRRFSNFMDHKIEHPWLSVKKTFFLNFGSVFIGSFAIAVLGIAKKIPELVKLFFSPLIFFKHLMLNFINNDNQSWTSLAANFVITLFSSPLHALLYYIVNSFSRLFNMGIKYFDGIVISISGITGKSFKKSTQQSQNIKESNEKNCFDCSTFIGFILFVGQFGITWATYIIMNIWNGNNNTNFEDEKESILEITKKIDDLGLIVLICNKIFFGLIKSIIQASFDTSLVYYLNDKQVINVPHNLIQYQIIDRFLDIEEWFSLDIEQDIEKWFKRIQGDEFQDFEDIFEEFLPFPGD